MQRRVLEFIARSSHHGVIEATAGSGKTTTLVQVARSLPVHEAACFLAFNRVTAAELRSRLPPHVHATTLHALGLATLHARSPTTQFAAPDPQKYERLAGRLLESTEPEARPVAASLARLAGFARLTLTPPDDALQVQRLAVRFDLREHASGGDRAWSNALLGPLLSLGLEEVAEGQLDFTDMLYAPVSLHLEPERYAFVSVDEAQDLSPLALEFVRRLIANGARALFVGDPHQAIYGFAGAGHGSLRRAAELTQATTLPLSVSFRCPRRHVVLARRFSPEMTSAPGAPAGRVSVLAERALATAVAPGDLIMSRVNDPLVGIALRVAARGVPVRLLGVDLAGPSVKLAERVVAASGECWLLSPAEAEEAVNEHGRAHRHQLERDLLSSAALAEALRTTKEWHQALLLVLRSIPDRGPVPRARLLEMIAATAQGLFVVADEAADTAPADAPVDAPVGAPTHAAPADPVVLSTIHKAKGREADRVYLLYPEELAPHGQPLLPPAERETARSRARRPPHSGALSGDPAVPVRPDLEERQTGSSEANVLFVALTRARSEICFVERRRGAIAERLALPRGATDLGLPARWDEVLSLAALMSRGVAARGGRTALASSTGPQRGRRAVSRAVPWVR